MQKMLKFSILNLAILPQIGFKISEFGKIYFLKKKSINRFVWKKLSDQKSINRFTPLIQTIRHNICEGKRIFFWQKIALAADFDKFCKSRS